MGIWRENCVDNKMNIINKYNYKLTLSPMGNSEAKKKKKEEEELKKMEE